MMKALKVKRITLISICGFWLIATLVNGAWIPGPLNQSWILILITFLGTHICSAPMLVATIWLISQLSVDLLKKRTFQEILPFGLLIGTFLIVAFLPTRATWILMHNRQIIDDLQIQAEGTTYKDVFYLDRLPRAQQQMAQVPSIKRGIVHKDYSGTCLELQINWLSLVYTSSGNLSDCPNTWPWARRIDDHWFETSDGLALWFMQPKRTISILYEASRSGVIAVPK